MRNIKAYFILCFFIILYAMQKTKLHASTTVHKDIISKCIFQFLMKQNSIGFLNTWVYRSMKINYKKP